MFAKKYSLLFGLGIAAVLAAAFVLWQNPKLLTTWNFSGEQASTTSATINLGNGVSVPTSGEGVAVLPIENASAKAPSLNRNITISTNLEPEAAQIVKTNIQNTTAQLKENPDQLRLWLQLGVYLKIAGDYQGAKEAWEYVAAAAPSNYIAFNNLGDLYMGYIKDYPKSELNYKKLIELRPDYIDGYRNLNTLYTVYKSDTSAAYDMLTLGLKYNPNDPDLKKMLADYNKTHVQ